MMSKTVFVTGGNAGIGHALCKQLVLEDGCYVFMGSRSVERGLEALKSLGSEVEGKIEVVQCDVDDQKSIASAAEHVKTKLKDTPLWALVNNAGTGLKHGTTRDQIIATNFYGALHMTQAFLPLLQPKGGRIVHVGSGAGPMWLNKQEADVQKFFVEIND